jgi:predicted DNA-binding transcriptional regulator AlpA
MTGHPDKFGGADMELSTQAKLDGKRSRRKLEYVPDDPLLTAAEAAAERGQAISTFWRDVAAKRVPPAYYVSPRCPRWRRSELRMALEACRALVKGAA